MPFLFMNRKAFLLNEFQCFLLLQHNISQKLTALFYLNDYFTRETYSPERVSTLITSPI